MCASLHYNHMCKTYRLEQRPGPGYTQHHTAGTGTAERTALHTSDIQPAENTLQEGTKF